MRMFKALALASFMLCGVAAPVLAAPATVAEEVAAFDKPTQAERLAVLRGLLEARGLTYEVRPFNSGKPGAPEGYNVVVTLAAGGEKDILLTAHYDALVLQDGTLVNGVVDNAASVVALLRAADALKATTFTRGLRIVFFDQEERGLLGAAAYAASPDGQRVGAVFNFDINAYGDTPFYAAATTPVDAPLEAVVKAACQAARETCRGLQAYPPSDHLAFRKALIPSTSFSYLPAAEVDVLEGFMAQLAKGERPSGPPPRILGLIHTPQDTMEVVDPSTIEKAAFLAVQMALTAEAAR
ncbi:MAG: M20/M25/M40 family metallo-hydrolase [Caulobacter sp.]|nr:M20/M25/M40 family metallo-hydrolase [Caulobacter sp.]